ncbi:MAG: iron-containing alcohol dehydrogenase [Methanopyri archaeon]|nr:iron-containing alcohol dehydrogenase [Methanopyri archaeon]
MLAYGGCTALDVARAAAVGKELVVIPASIATAGISVDKSILNYDGEDRSERTMAPSRVIVSLTDMLGTDHAILDRLSRSGFGDYFASISASIDVQYRAGDLSMDAVRRNVPENFKAVEWVCDEFSGYDEECMRQLATYAHNYSLGVISGGDGTPRVGGEHKLYYQMMAQHDRYRGAAHKPTHGELVATGILVACKLLGEATGDTSLYDDMRTAYGRLGLPTDYADLSAIGIERADLVKGLEAITDTDTYLGAHFSQGDYAVLDRVFVG